jgi:hypothetical protein
MAEDKGVNGCVIQMDGKTLASSSGSEAPALLESVQVDKRLDSPDMFQFDLHMRPEGDIQVLDEVREGKPIEIRLGPAGDEKTVVKGEVHYIEPHFRAGGQSTLTVGGFDRSHRLTRGTQSRTWGDGYQPQDLYPSVVQDVISKAAEVQGTRDGLTPDQVKGPKSKAMYVPQLNASDYLFMKWLGADADKKVEAATLEDDSKVSFYDVDVTRQPVKVLTRAVKSGGDETGVHEAQFSLSTVRQVARVEVRGWDPKRKKAIVGKAEASDLSFGGQPGWKATGQALYGKEDAGKVLTIVDRPVDSKEEADAVAKSIFNQLSLEFITGEADFPGDPAVKPGDVVEMKAFGERFSGKYLVTQATHLMNPRSTGFTTRIKFVRNEVGKGEGT